MSRAVETLLSYELESELLCETNYASSSLSTLVCDCVGDGGLFYFILFYYYKMEFIYILFPSSPFSILFPKQHRNRSRSHEGMHR